MVSTANRYSIGLHRFHGRRWWVSRDCCASRFQWAQHGWPTSFTPFQLTGYPQVVHMLDALRQREIYYGFIATDTLLSPNCRVALDRIISSRFAIIGNIRVAESVCLCALPGVEVCSTDCIMSNWQLLTRYEDYILHLEIASNQLIHTSIVRQCNCMPHRPRRTRLQHIGFVQW